MARFLSLIRRYKRLFTLAALLLFIGVWLVLLSLISPRELVAYLGVENGYALMFAVALVGGISSLTSPSYYATIATLALGGLDPLLLGLISGLAISVGDTLYYVLGKNGRVLVHGGRYEEKVARLTCWLAKQPRWRIPVLTYVMVSFTPIPNDLLAAGLALVGCRYVTVIVPLVLGNITLTILAAWLARSGGALIAL